MICVCLMRFHLRGTISDSPRPRCGKRSPWRFTKAGNLIGCSTGGCTYNMCTSIENDEEIRCSKRLKHGHAPSAHTETFYVVTDTKWRGAQLMFRKK